MYQILSKLEWLKDNISPAGFSQDYSPYDAVMTALISDSLRESSAPPAPSVLWLAMLCVRAYRGEAEKAALDLRFRRSHELRGLSRLINKVYVEMLDVISTLEIPLLAGYYPPDQCGSPFWIGRVVTRCRAELARRDAATAQMKEHQHAQA